MMKSTKRLHAPEPQTEQLVAEPSFDSQTPACTRPSRKTYRRNTSTTSQVSRQKSCKKLTKARSIATKTLKNVLYSSFDYRSTNKLGFSSHKEYSAVPRTEKRPRKTTSK